MPSKNKINRLKYVYTSVSWLLLAVEGLVGMLKVTSPGIVFSSLDDKLCKLLELLLFDLLPDDSESSSLCSVFTPSLPMSDIAFCRQVIHCLLSCSSLA